MKPRSVHPRRGLLELFWSFSFPWFLLLLVVLTAAQLVSFSMALGGSVFTHDPLNGYNVPAFSRVLGNSLLPQLSLLKLVLTVILLGLAALPKGSNPVYTLRRLSLSEQEIFGWNTFYNSCCLLILWMVELLVTVYAFQLYAARLPQELVTHNLMPIQFYTIPYLRGLYPLSEPLSLVRNLVCLAALAASCGAQVILRNHGQQFTAPYFLAAAVAITFPRAVGSFVMDGILLGAALFFGGWSVWSVLELGKEESA